MLNNLKKYLLPLYLGNEGFEIPFCCHGNDVNCDLCGSFGVFHMAAAMRENPKFRLDETNDINFNIL